MADGPRPRKAILGELRRIAGRLAALDGLYARRRAIFREGQAAGITQRDMAEASGIGETAVTKDLKRDAARSA